MPSGLLQFSVTVAMRRFVYPAEISGMLTAPPSCWPLRVYSVEKLEIAATENCRQKIGNA
jgi:hypothetical protein